MADVLELVIGSEQQAIDAFHKALDGGFDNLSVLIRFDGWPSLDIDVKGDRYHSSLPSGMLKGLSDYQAAIYRAYASIVYGRSAKSLTEDDRKEVELVFEVAEGSTETKADLEEALTKLGEKAIEKMTGKQLVVTILGGALLACGYFTSTHWMDAQVDIATEQSKAALVTSVLAQNEHLAQLQADVAKAAMNVIKGAYDADQISIGDVTLTRDQIQAINQRSRENSAVQRIDGKFEVLQLKRLEDRWRVVLYSEVSGQVQTDLFKGQNAVACLDELTAAFKNNTTVELLVLGRYKGGAIQSATILGSAVSGLLAPDAAQPDLTQDEDD